MRSFTGNFVDLTDFIRYKSADFFLMDCAKTHVPGRVGFALTVAAVGFFAASCTSTSSLTNTSRMLQDPNSPLNARAVDEASKEGADAENTAVSSEGIVGASKPASSDPVAVDRPAVERINLASIDTVITQPTYTKQHKIPEDYNGMKMVRTTAYCHKEADSLKYGTLNAAGTNLQYGNTIRSAAADWSVYPMGTKFQIEGLPYTYVVDDYGSALVGSSTIDLYKPTFAQMNRWGVRNVPMKIIEWGSFEKSAEILSGRKHVSHADHVRTMLREIEKRGYRSQSTRA